MSFSMDPEFYGSMNYMQRRDAAVVLRMYRRYLNNLKPEVILDLGCGPGNITSSTVAPSFPSGSRVVGVDKSAAMIKHATLYFSKEGVNYVMLDILDDQQLEQFINLHGTFTKVVSFYCLHWIKDQKKALENIKRLLKDEGECLLMFVAQCPVFVMYQEMAKKPEWAEYMTDVEDYVPSSQNSLHPDEDFSRLMEEAGLKVVSCKLLRQSYTFECADDLVDSVQSFNPFFPRIPDGRENDYMKASLQVLGNLSYKPKRQQSDGRTFPYLLLVAHGRRHSSE